MADLTERIEEVAAGPASASVGDRSSTAQSLPDLVAADKYLKQQEAQAAVTNPVQHIRRVKIVPPGAHGI